MKALPSAAGAFALLLALNAPSPAVSAARVPPPAEVSWQSAGDSYSSGEGVFGNKGDCAQSEDAYGPATADLLRSRGWGITNETFTACTGHLVEDYFNSRVKGGKSLWDWGRAEHAPERIDVITMSFGGNDIGFADVISQCLVPLPDTWHSPSSGLTGCDEAEGDLSSRIDRLLDPAAECTGRRNDRAVHDLNVSADGFDCNLALAGRRGSIIDFYYDIVTQRLTDRGRLYIVGYPRLFADVNEWPGWVKVGCQLVLRGDTEKLDRVAEHFNDQLRVAVDRTNRALGSDRVVFVPQLASYRDGHHELCGTGRDWLNGIASDRDTGFAIRKQTSFHPNKAGHAAAAKGLADTVATSFPRPQPTTTTPAQGSITSFDMMNARLPVGTCNSPDGTSWLSNEPIQLMNGSGNNIPGDLADGDSSVVGVMSTSVVGYADLDHDGTTDALLEVECTGSLIETCCAGRASILTVALPVHLNGSQLALIGTPLWGEPINDADSQITNVDLDGTSIRTTESVIYPESDGFFADQQRTYAFDGKVWVRK